MRLDVVDPQGRLVRVLVDGELPAGSHDARWDGRDESGRAMASGVYLSRLRADDVAETGKMVLVR